MLQLPPLHSGRCLRFWGARVCAHRCTGYGVSPAFAKPPCTACRGGTLNWTDYPSWVPQVFGVSGSGHVGCLCWWNSHSVRGLRGRMHQAQRWWHWMIRQSRHGGGGILKLLGGEGTSREKESNNEKEHQPGVTCRGGVESPYVRWSSWAPRLPPWIAPRIVTCSFSPFRR